MSEFGRVMNDSYFLNTRIGDLQFELTGDMCPEQYDVYLGEQRIAYVRLRGGYMRVDFPEVGEKVIFSHEFEDMWKGAFDGDAERFDYLSKAASAICDYLIELIKNGGSLKAVGKEVKK